MTAFDADGRCANPTSQNQPSVDVRNLYGSGLGGKTVNAQNYITYGNQNPNAIIDPNSLEGRLAILGQAQATAITGSMFYRYRVHGRMGLYPPDLLLFLP